MAEAKINITAEAHDEGLKRLNTALAEGQQSVKAMQKELKDLEKATVSGTKATSEQASAMRRLQQPINEQKQVNSQSMTLLKVLTIFQTVQIPPEVL